MKEAAATEPAAATATSKTSAANPEQKEKESSSAAPRIVAPAPQKTVEGKNNETVAAIESPIKATTAANHAMPSKTDGDLEDKDDTMGTSVTEGKSDAEKTATPSKYDEKIKTEEAATATVAAKTSDSNQKAKADTSGNDVVDPSKGAVEDRSHQREPEAPAPGSEVEKGEEDGKELAKEAESAATANEDNKPIGGSQGGGAALVAVEGVNTRAIAPEATEDKAQSFSSNEVNEPVGNGGGGAAAVEGDEAKTDAPEANEGRDTVQSSASNEVNGPVGTEGGVAPVAAVEGETNKTDAPEATEDKGIAQSSASQETERKAQVFLALEAKGKADTSMTEDEAKVGEERKRDLEVTRTVDSTKEDRLGAPVSSNASSASVIAGEAAKAMPDALVTTDTASGGEDKGKETFDEKPAMEKKEEATTTQPSSEEAEKDPPAAPASEAESSMQEAKQEPEEDGADGDEESLVI
jgi:hypothetical protein